MSEKNEKVFRGVWIPAEIWETHTLSWMEKCLWAEISSLGTEEKPCFASNGFLAAKFNSTESSISNMISRLKSMGMIKHLSYDGRSRKMIAILSKETSPTSEVRVNPQVKSDFTRECNRDTSRVTKVELPLTPSKGNEENSAEASHSSTHELPLTDVINGAGAQAGKANALDSLPPNAANARASRNPRKSPPMERPSDVSEENWLAFCDLRKIKRAPVTVNALNLLRKEAGKAGWSLDDAINECVLRNWQGFKAEWLKKEKSKTVTPHLPNGEIDWANVKPRD